jgi:peptidoglycan/LPS O-acetylase OafA/YrhL
MYVFHDLVLTLIGNILPDVLPPSTTLTGVWLIKILLAYPCTYLLALISWKLLEKRFLNLRKRYSRPSLRHVEKVAHVVRQHRHDHDAAGCS